jgi:hypothetical protein
MKNLKQKVFNAVQNWKLKIVEWKRKRYNYIISIQELVWARNLKDWYNIDIFDLENNYLETIKIEIKMVCEFWCVHNKMFLEN